MIYRPPQKAFMSQMISLCCWEGHRSAVIKRDQLLHIALTAPHRAPEMMKYCWWADPVVSAEEEEERSENIFIA